MLLQLHCSGHSIGLQLPAYPADVQQKLNTLRNGSEQNAPISFRDVNEPLSYLRQYIQNVDLTSSPELEKLNQLSEKVDGMSTQEQHILWGALDADNGMSAAEQAIRLFEAGVPVREIGDMVGFGRAAVTEALTPPGA